MYPKSFVLVDDLYEMPLTWMEEKKGYIYDKN